MQSYYTNENEGFRDVIMKKLLKAIIFRQMINKSAFFNADWYKLQYLSNKSIDPAFHYLLFGNTEHIDPSPIFSTKEYYIANNDVLVNHQNALLHYELYGRRENRKIIRYDRMLKNMKFCGFADSGDIDSGNKESTEAIIKIFVACKEEAYVPDNPLLFPIQTGATLTKSKFQGMLADDTGENISHLNDYYCELSAQFWAWKNVEADYYGFFHNRRYLSFNPKLLWETENIGIEFQNFSDEMISRLHLTEEPMRNIIQRYDVIVPRPFNWLAEDHLGITRTVECQYGACKEHDTNDLKCAIDILKKMYPDYILTADEYMQYSNGYYLNMYILKKDIFFSYCEWLFPILDELFRTISFENRSKYGKRAIGFVAERLFGIFLTKLKKDNPNLRVAELQNSFIWDTKNISDCHNETNGSDIKIFVSHRIDIHSVNIENPLFFPIRCGAVYDSRVSHIPGDNSGDNISEKRLTYNELTVLYWAWKNIDADYYGLCHYRRYLSFSERKFPMKLVPAFIVEPYLSKSIISKYCLDEYHMRDIICKHDMITLNPFDVSLHGGNIIGHYGQFPSHFNLEDIQILLDVISDLFPDYYGDAKAYFSGNQHMGYNLFIYKKEIYFEFCSFLFGVLSEVENRVDITKYNNNQIRVFGYLSEHLFAIFYQHQRKNSGIRTKFLQPILFENTEKVQYERVQIVNDCIPVVITCSRTEYQQLCVCIQSILSNSDNAKQYEIIILHQNLDLEVQSYIKSWLSDIDNFSITFLDPSILFEDYSYGFSQSALPYFGVISPYILLDYSKAIYLHPDVIVNSDLARLFETDISQYLAGAVKDLSAIGRVNMKEVNFINHVIGTLKVTEPYEVINPGVLLINLNQYRRKYSEHYVLGLIDHYKSTISEWDIVNHLFFGMNKLIDYAWNLPIESNPTKKMSINAVPKKEFSAYQAARISPYIVHYEGIIFPYSSIKDDYFPLFWYYAKKSRVYEDLIISASANLFSMRDIKRVFVTFIRRRLVALKDKTYQKGKSFRLFITRLPRLFAKMRM